MGTPESSPGLRFSSSLRPFLHVAYVFIRIPPPDGKTAARNALHMFLKQASSNSQHVLKSPSLALGGSSPTLGFQHLHFNRRGFSTQITWMKVAYTLMPHELKQANDISTHNHSVSSSQSEEPWKHRCDKTLVCAWVRVLHVCVSECLQSKSCLLTQAFQ